MNKNVFSDLLQWMQAKFRPGRRDFLKMATATAGAVALGKGLLTTPARATTSTAAQPAATLDIWNLPAFSPASGLFQPDPTWTTIAQHYRFPDWYRDAKYGILQNWSPESVPEHGDWYGRFMYMQGTGDYQYHLSHYGHPSTFGYKDLTHLFTGSQWNPASLLQLYVQQGGAKYFVALASDHADFDNWDSTYQPWNSQTVGRKSDIIGEWAVAARAQKVPFGVTYGACPQFSWGSFMPVRYGHDTTGAYAGVPYDGLQTAADGMGKWWNGLDPVDINGPVHSGTNYHPKDSDPFVRQFYWRIDDLITKHKPDLLDFDADIVPGDPTAATDYTIPNQAYVIAANYFNKSLQWNGGKQNGVLSIRNAPKPANEAVVQDYKGAIAPAIQDYPWQAQASLGALVYSAPNPITMSAATLISNLINTVSKNGNYLINVPLHGDGHLDQAAIDIVQHVGNWLQVNGEAIYATRPFALPSEIGAVGRTFFTRNGGVLYALITSWPSGSTLAISSFQKGSPYLGNVTSVELLGHSGALSFTQDTSALTIQLPPSHVSSDAYVFKVTQDKVLVNNDDKGFTYTGTGWVHQANRGFGDSNNNVHMTTHDGDSVSYTFTGTGVDYITETNSDEGTVALYIDGSLKKTANASSASRKAQVTLARITGLSSGSHTIKLVKTSGTLMLLDALKIHP